MTDSTVAAAALPNDLSPDELRLRPAADGRVAVGPSRAGWRHLSFEAFTVPSSGCALRAPDGHESAIVILAGGGLRVVPERGGPLVLEGRGGVFEGPAWAVYLPAGMACELDPLPGGAARGVEVARAMAPVAASHPGSYGAIIISPAMVATEIRGAGHATRQVEHIITPEFPASRLELVEVYTPGGNWSSWPAHKHDVDDMPREAVLEEVYHYRFRRPEGWGLQRLYRRDGSRDAAWAVSGGDVVLVTDGYHPFAAADGYDAYYLNALAGDRRTMAASDDPDLTWVRDTWSERAPDTRLPLIRHPG